MQTLFISSTFKDMHYERDAIRDMALPKINTAAKTYGQEVSVCDLRWGINTLDLDGEEGSKKVLDVCLDQIDRCSPPMIVLLGNRYGYIPDNGVIRNAARIKQLELEQLEISVTALEIEYGFLSRKTKPRVLFYFRETINAPDDYQSEDAEHAAKIAELKSRILKVVGDNYRTYTVDYSAGAPDMSEFADMVAADVTQSLLPEWKEKARLSAFELDRKTQWDFIADRSAIFRGRDGLIDNLLNMIERGERRIVVKGAAGSGKSMVFSKLASVLQACGYDVLPFVGGLTTESNDSLDILRNTVVYLQNKLDGTPHGEVLRMHAECGAAEWAELAASYIDKYCSAGNKFVIMADAVDQLYDDDLRKSNAFVPDCNNKNFVFFATCTDEFAGLDSCSIRIAGLTETERKSVIKGIMSQYNRELDPTVSDAMVKLSAADSPLYLSFLVKRLLMMDKSDYDEIGKRGGQMDAISQHQHGIISSCPATAEEMCALLIDEAGKRINKKLIASVVKYMACSRFGLRQSDLAALTGDEWNTLDFLHFVMYLGDCFILRDDGRYDFSHKSIRHGILKSTDTKRIHDKIAEYFWSIRDDGIAQSEMLYHFIGADNKRMFYYYVITAAYDVIKNAKKDKASAIMNEAAFGTLGMRMMSVVEFTSDGGEWIARAIEAAPCENEAPALGFIMSIMGLLMTEMRLRVHTESLLAVSEALLNYATRAQKSGFDVDALILSLRWYYGQACALNNNLDEYKGIANDNYAIAQAAYRANPNDVTLGDYIGAVLPRVFSSYNDDDFEAQLNELFDEISELSEIAGDRYEAEPNNLTALNNCFMLLACAVWNFFNDGYELFLDNVKEALECILPHALQYGDIELVPILELLLTVADMASDKYILYLQNGDYDPNSAESDYEYVDEDDEDEYDEDEYDDEDDEDDDECTVSDMCRYISDAAERIYNAVMAIFLGMNEKNHTGFEAHACKACIKLSAIRFAEGAMEHASNCLDIAEDVIAKIDSAGKLTPDMRAMAYKIKSMRLNIRISGGDTDYNDMLTQAREVLRDVENISSDTGMHNETLAEALSAFVGIYVQKLIADRAAGRLDLNDVTEAETQCDRLAALLSKLASFNASAEEELAAVRNLLATLKS